MYSTCAYMTDTMENYEMLKALYDFQAAHAKTMSFNEGDYFILYQTSAKQRNWWPVVNIKGNIGFVPSNYVMKLKVDPHFLLTFLDSSIDSLKEYKDDNINGIIKKSELLQRLSEKRHCMQQSLQCEENGDKCTENNVNQINQNTKDIEQLYTNETPSRSVDTSPGMEISNSTENLLSQITVSTVTVQLNRQNDYAYCKEKNITENVIEENNHIDESNNPSENGEINRSYTAKDVYRLIDEIRKHTNLSFDFSCDALRVVLVNLEKLLPEDIISHLKAITLHLTDKPEIPKEFLGKTHDAKRLQYIFSNLSDFKNDSEQRTWMLHEDEEDIVQILEELVDILKNADENICCYEMSCDHYQSLINLIQYYQMESRWRIKNLLLKVFTAACHLDHIAVDILLTSILPLEIAQDMKNKYSNLDEFMELTKTITLIFSLGQMMPINHQEYLNEQFITFLLEIVEQNNSDSLIDSVIAFILAFNLQFSDNTQNIVIDAIRDVASVKILTQKLLFLLNREDDPVKLLKHKITTPNSVLKMLEDLFSFPETASHFYTNDVMVLIDILVRQLSDLSAGDPRKQYLEVFRKILRNTNYVQHTHRKQDLIKIFTRIFCEETESSADDQQLVRDIANEFPQIFKT